VNSVQRLHKWLSGNLCNHPDTCRMICAGTPGRRLRYTIRPLARVLTRPNAVVSTLLLHLLSSMFVTASLLRHQRALSAKVQWNRWLLSTHQY
jgi:hypothetical protein